MEYSVRAPTVMMAMMPGMRPRTLTVAGRAMMPAPTTVVERLKTPPEKEAPSTAPSSLSSHCLGRSGARF